MDPQVAPDAGPISNNYRLDVSLQPGAVITPRQDVARLLLSPVLSKHRLHLLWLVAGAIGDEYLWESELVWSRNRVPVLRMPLETHVRTGTAGTTGLFSWAAGVASATLIANTTAQCQYLDAVSGLTQTVAVPCYELDAEADALTVNVNRNNTISGTGISNFWLSLLLYSRKP